MTTTCSPLARVKPSAPKRIDATSCAALGRITARRARSTATARRRLDIILSLADGRPRWIWRAPWGSASALADHGPAISATMAGTLRLKDAFEQRLLLALDDHRLALGRRLAGRGVL